MAEVTLDRLWLHDADAPETYLRFFTTDRGDTRAVDGEIRTYANGRRRLVTRAGSARTLPVTLRQVSDADLDVLEEWRGRLVMVRDHRGRLFFGTYFSIDVTDYKDRSGYDVAVEVADVTHSIEV